jgi:hypothetical protein
MFIVPMALSRVDLESVLARRGEFSNQPQGGFLEKPKNCKPCLVPERSPLGEEIFSCNDYGKRLEQSLILMNQLQRWSSLQRKRFGQDRVVKTTPCLCVHHSSYAVGNRVVVTKLAV